MLKKARDTKIFGWCIVVVTVLAILPVGEVNADADQFIMEGSLDWLPADSEEMEVRDITTGDVDGDDEPEIVVLGHYRSSTTGLIMGVLEYIDSGLTQEAETSWEGEAWAVGAEDLDQDGTLEIVTGGYLGDESELLVWRLVGGTFELQASATWDYVAGRSEIHDIVINDIDVDGVIEIVTVGASYDIAGNPVGGEINIFFFTDTGLHPDMDSSGQPYRWQDFSGETPPGMEGYSEAHAVDIFQTDYDGITGFEIVIAGSIKAVSSNIYLGQLAVWDYENNNPPQLLRFNEWNLANSHNFMVMAVAIGEIDGVMGTEIVTGGSESILGPAAEIAVWDGLSLALKDNHVVWDEDKSYALVDLAIDDVDIDAKPEIVVGLIQITGSITEKLIMVLSWNSLFNEITFDSPSADMSYGRLVADTSILNAITLADWELDGVKEIIVGGNVFIDPDQLGTIDIWNWNVVDKTVVILDSKEWFHSIYERTEVFDVAIGDVDGVGNNDIVTAGSVSLFNGVHKGQLALWRWDGSDLDDGKFVEFDPYPPRHQDKVWFTSVAIGNIDNDPKLEVVAVGHSWYGFDAWGVIAVYEYNNGQDTLIPNNFPNGGYQVFWREDNQYDTSCNAVAIGSVDDTPADIEIVTVGEIFNTQSPDKLNVRIWRWNDVSNSIELDTLDSWFLLDGDFGTSVAIGDVDVDNRIEIVAGIIDDWVGYLAIWVYNGVDTLVEDSIFDSWDHVNDIAISNLDTDSYLEIIAGGESQVNIWQWDDSQESREAYKNNPEGRDNPRIESVSYGNVDGDVDIEIVAAGWIGNGDYFVWGLISVYRWVDTDPFGPEELILESYEEWYTVRGTVCMGVAVGTFGTDTNIVTGGSAHDHARPRGQVRMWEKAV